jgi:hypothetical protein
MTAAIDIDTTATTTTKHLIDLLLSLVFRADVQIMCCECSETRGPMRMAR